MAIRPLQTGEPITAAWIADLVAAVNALSEQLGRAGGGKVADAAVLAGVLGSPDEFILCRIVEVELSPAAGPGPAYLPSTVTYRVKGIRRPGIDLAGLTPVFGRPVRMDEARIYPASIDTVCYIVRTPARAGTGGHDAELMLLPDSEVVARRRCDLPGGARVTPEMIERERRRLGLPRVSLAGGTATAAGGAADAGGGTPAPGGGGRS